MIIRLFVILMLLPSVAALAEDRPQAVVPSALDSKACEFQARLERAKDAYLQVLGWAEERQTYRKDHAILYTFKYIFPYDGLALKHRDYLRQFRKEMDETRDLIKRMDRGITYPLAQSEAEKRKAVLAIEENLDYLESRIGQMAALHELAFEGKNMHAAPPGGMCKEDGERVSLLQRIRELGSDSTVAAMMVDGGSAVSSDSGESEEIKIRFEEEGYAKDFLDLEKCKALIAVKFNKYNKADEEEYLAQKAKDKKTSRQTSDTGDTVDADAILRAVKFVGAPTSTDGKDQKLSSNQNNPGATATHTDSTDKSETDARKPNKSEKTLAQKSTGSKPNQPNDGKSTDSKNQAMKQALQPEVRVAKGKTSVTPPKEVELTLDEDGTARIVTTAQKEPDLKTDFENKDQDKKTSAVALQEEKKLLEKVKKQFTEQAQAAQAEVKKAKATKTEETRLTQVEQEELANKQIRGKKDLVGDAQKMLARYKNGTPEFDYSDFFLQTEANEKLEQGKDLSVKQFQKLYARYLKSKKRYEQIAKNTQGTNDDKIMAVAHALNTDYNFEWVDGHAQVLDVLDGKGGNCVAQTKLITAVMKDLGVNPNKGTSLGVQVFDDHIQAVLFKKSTNEVTTLVNGAPMTGLIAPIYKPESLIHQYLVSENQSTPTKYEDFLIQDMPAEVREKAKQALAKAEAEKGGIGALLSRAFGGRSNDSKLNFPKSGIFFGRDGGFNPMPSYAFQQWAGGAPSTSALDYYGGANIDPNAWDAFSKFMANREEYEPPRINFDKAKRDLEKVFQSSDYKNYMDLRQNPWKLKDGAYTDAQIKDYSAVQDKIYTILSGKDYVDGKNKDDGYSRLRHALGKDNQELLAFYEFSKKERDAYFKSGADGDNERQKYFDLFKVLGPKSWAMYKELEIPKGDEFYLSEALNKVNLIGWEGGPRELGRYFVQAEKVGYLAKYQKEMKSPDDQPREDKTQPNPADKPELPKKTAATKPDPKRQKLEQQKMAQAGFGKDASGVKLKPEKTALIKLDAVTFGQFIEQAGAEAWPDILKRWTPTFSAALRDQKSYTPDLVEWFSRQGYRKIAESRKAESLVVSGPDKKDIPKDVAVLLVDLLRNKDGTTADKSQIKLTIEQNYGSVDKYVDLVKSEFGETKKQLAAKQDKPDKTDKTSNFDLFKKLADERHVDASVMEQAEKKSFEYKTRPPETFGMGSPADEKGRWEKGEAQHSVKLTKPYDIQFTHVTQLQWYLVMGNNPSRFRNPEAADGDHITANGVEINANHPVEMVSWNEVKEFIAKLNERDSKYTYRLPTDAEWEAAARAGTKTAYSFGDSAGQDDETLKQNAWFFGNSGNRTHAVAQKPANPDGLYDMAGNVWDWVEDWYTDKPTGGENPTGPSRGSDRVLRGGSWFNLARYLRSAFRAGARPDYAGDYIGFRLVRTPK